MPNHAAILIHRILRIRRPRPVEPDQYESQSEALMILRRHLSLTRDQMAFKLGLTVPMLDKAESGTLRLQLDELTRVEKLARISNLPVMSRFFHILHISTRQHKKLGAPKTTAKWWKEEDR
jgi:hypothetical protein